MQVAYPLLRAGIKRALPAIGRVLRGRAAKRVAVGLGGAAAAYQGYRGIKGVDSDNSTRTAAGGATSFRSNVTTKRKSRLSRKGRRRRRIIYKRKRRFAKKVTSVMRARQAMSWLQDTQNATPGRLFSNTVSTVKPFNIAGRTLENGTQYIMGESQQFQLMPGPLWSTTQGFRFIRDESAKYTQDITSGVTVPIPATTESIEQMAFTVSNQRLQLTIENASYTKTNPDLAPAGYTWTAVDVTADIYEFVAKQDINDADYRSAKAAWYTLLSNSSSTVPSDPHAMSCVKGATPLDCRNLGKYWKLIGKSRVSIPYNTDMGVTPYQTLTYSSKHKFIKWRQWEGLYAKKGITHSFIIIFEPDLTSSKVVTVPPAGAFPYANIWSQKQTHYKPVNGSMLHTSISAPNVLQSTITGSTN